MYSHLKFIDKYKTNKFCQKHKKMSTHSVTIRESDLETGRNAGQLLVVTECDICQCITLGYSTMKLARHFKELTQIIVDTN